MRKKKVLFLQIKGNSFGGVWNVNRLVGEELIKKNYEVHVVSIRNNQIDINLEYDPKMIVKTINEKDKWESYLLNDVLSMIKKIHYIKAIKMICSKIKYNIGLKKDAKKLHKYIYDNKPDYIITSHYQLLDMIPQKYLNKTIHEQHSSFKDIKDHRATIKTFKKYNNKITFLWLTKKSMESAQKIGLNNNNYIYNAVRFKSKEKANVVKNKKLITIARLSKEKRIDIMIDIVKNIFKDKKYKDWNLEIFGIGDAEEKLKQHINNHNQIKLMGITNNPQKEFLSSSINLNTSPSEGFSLSILEGNECGVPTIAFNFGESVEEEILDNKTGIIAKDINDYQEKLIELMDNSEKLTELSNNAKEFSKNFQIENIINNWIKLFGVIDNQDK